MKYKLLSLFAFTVIIANAQSEWAPIGAKWYYNCCANGNIMYSHLNYIVSEKDTIVEENNCRVLKRYYDNSNIASEKYILKESEGKIYYYYQNQFNLLFDFDVEVNDIVEFTFMYKEYDDDFPLYKDTVLSARYQVESITTNTQNLKTFTTKIIEDDKFADNGIEIIPWYYSYTEKTGFYREFIPVLDNLAHIAVDDFPMLRCYSDANFSFVSDQWAALSLPCNYSISADMKTPEYENIKIYPNPVFDNIFVFVNDGGSIEITDVSGKVVYRSELSDGIAKISTIHLLKGTYFVKIRHKDGNTQMFKIIKS